MSSSTQPRTSPHVRRPSRDRALHRLCRHCRTAPTASSRGAYDEWQVVCGHPFATRQTVSAKQQTCIIRSIRRLIRRITHIHSTHESDRLFIAACELHSRRPRFEIDEGSPSGGLSRSAGPAASSRRFQDPPQDVAEAECPSIRCHDPAVWASGGTASPVNFFSVSSSSPSPSLQSPPDDLSSSNDENRR